MDETWDDDPGSLLQHARKEFAIEANGGEQVGVEGAPPIVVAEGEDTAARRARAAHVVDQNVEAPETVPHLPRHLADALRGADVSLDEELHRLTFRQRRPRWWRPSRRRPRDVARWPRPCPWCRP